MDKLFNLVIYSTMYATITGGLILIIKLLLKDNLTPKWTYILWLVLILKLVMPIGPESSLSIFNKINVCNQYESALKSRIYINDEIEVADKSNLSINQDLEISPLANNNHLTKDADIKVEYTFFNYMSLIWACIVITLAITMCLFYFKLIYKLKDNSITSQKINFIFEKSKKRCRVTKYIELIINDEIDTPAIVGIIKPKILFPRSLVNLSNAEIEFIFLHELCHYKRKDNYISSILLILQIVHWFNPCIRYLFKRIKQDIELATDYNVSKILDSDELIPYATTILTVLANMSNKKNTTVLLNMANNKRNVEERIMNIKHMKNNIKNKFILTIIGVLTLSIVSPLVLTNSKGNDVYANNNHSTFTNTNDFNIVQNKYFKISEMLKSNVEFTGDDVDKILEGTNFLKKVGTKGDSEIRYKYKNEEIILYNEIYKPSNIGGAIYKIYDPNDGLTVLRVCSYNYDDMGWHSLFEVSSESISTINDLSIKLGMDISKTSIFEDYKNIVNEVDKGYKLEDTILNDIYPKLKEDLKINDPYIKYYKTKFNNHEFAVQVNNKTKDLYTMSLNSLDKNDDVSEHLDTLKIVEPDYQTLRYYNISKEAKFVHSLYKSRADIEELKNLVLKVLN